MSEFDSLCAQVNSLVTFADPHTLEKRRQDISQRILSGAPVGRLAGLRYAAKDVHNTAGMRTTFGSPIFEHHIPERNDPVVARMLQQDALLVAKSNTPEFAAGSQTFNSLFGATLNPFDLSKTVGGSSGGAAAAVKLGLIDFGDGSDLAASLRNPAAFCGVVGMRPSSRAWPEIVPQPFSLGTLNQVGALTAHVALQREVWRALYQPLRLQSATQWRNERDTETQTRTLRARSARYRIAWTTDFDGLIPVENDVRQVMERSLQKLAANSQVELVNAWPDFTDADDCFQILRAQYFVQWLGELYKTERHRMKDTVAWNIEKGLAQSTAQVAWAERKRAEIFQRVADFMERFDGFALPTSQVLPFDSDQPHPTSINGIALDTYVDWLKSCYWITVSAHPAISIPCGVSDHQKPLPVGLQLVGKFGADEALLDLAEFAETLLA